MISIAVTEASQVAGARRSAVVEAHRLGFGEADAGRVALAATELATNLLRHAGGGEMLIGIHEDEAAPGVQLVAIDKGPGIANVDASLRDGYSTAGSAGTGLGAIMRQSDVFDIYSQPGTGTGVLSIVAAHGRRPGPSRPPIAWGGISIPAPGEDVCGDACAVRQRGAVTDLLVVDGLGHGTDAAVAAAAAVAAFRDAPDLPLTQLMGRLDAAASSTRGAAAALARLDREAAQLYFTGIGNIAGTILAAGRLRKPVSHNGILGHTVRRVQQFDYPLPPDALVVLHSDGLQTSWTLDKYPGLAARAPCLIGAILYRDFQRGRDDVTVLVARPYQP